MFVRAFGFMSLISKYIFVFESIIDIHFAENRLRLPTANNTNKNTPTQVGKDDDKSALEQACTIVDHVLSAAFRIVASEIAVPQSATRTGN